MSREQGHAELTRCAGTQFDPAFVDAFVIALARPAVNELDEGLSPFVASLGPTAAPKPPTRDLRSRGPGRARPS